ncbi:hypothetical protein ABZP36_005282 [Zizania latifolia]
MLKSMVVDSDSGKNVMSDVRTSSGMFLSKKQDEVVERIEERIAAWTLLPLGMHGEKCEPHLDYFRVKEHLAYGKNRMAIVLMYLSNVKMGVKPVKGNAVLFFSLHLNVTVDEHSLHGSCPVIKGEKWSATKWIHVRSLNNRRRSAVKCEDEDGLCPRWVAAEECAKNPGFMIGSKHYPGFCRKSCDVCTS